MCNYLYKVLFVLKDLVDVYKFKMKSRRMFKYRVYEVYLVFCGIF